MPGDPADAFRIGGSRASNVVNPRPKFKLKSNESPAGDRANWQPIHEHPDPLRRQVVDRGRDNVVDLLVYACEICGAT
jgi:hypothetical protein